MNSFVAITLVCIISTVSGVYVRLARGGPMIQTNREENEVEIMKRFLGNIFPRQTSDDSDGWTNNKRGFLERTRDGDLSNQLHSKLRKMTHPYPEFMHRFFNYETKDQTPFILH